MEQNTYEEKCNDALINEYSKAQMDDFLRISTLFETFIVEYECWDGMVAQLSDVLNKCDEIDYSERNTAYAYAAWHFLDRYHRFQITIKELLKRGYLCDKRSARKDILEVGAGPAQGLFAFSDHYATLNDIERQNTYSIQSDYVEQSDGFRTFLHHFVEYCMGKDKFYMVPFHHGRAKNAFKFPFEESNYDLWGMRSKLKYRNDIVIISNFLTTHSVVQEFKQQLTDICKYMRNYGLLIILGATEQSDKYKYIYDEVDRIINHRFRNKSFRGWWNKIFDETITYNYADEYGERLREYYCTIRNHLINKDLWNSVPKRAKDNLTGKIEQTKEKTKEENWSGIKWKVVVYQKHSFYKGKTDKTVVKHNVMTQDDSGWIYKEE